MEYLILENEFGDKFKWWILGGDSPAALPLDELADEIGPELVSADITAKLLTGFVAGAGTVAAADTILAGFNKLAGNTQNRAVTANLLTGLAAGSATPITATDTILVALANLQAQIDAL